jgi:hydroxymethylpyrimidine/phosphomethylpyrimidine kinase
MIDLGTAYTRAEALITANSIHGTGATANVVISPVGGHGVNPVRELAADKVMLNVQLKNSTSGVLGKRQWIHSVEHRVPYNRILRDPVLKCDSNNNLIAVESIANTSNSPNTLRFTTRLTNFL